MYRYPQLKVPAMDRQVVDNFKGYNHNMRIGDGEFYDMMNMTTDNAPVISTRKPRGVYREASGYLQGLIAKEKLCYVDGQYFVIGDEKVDMGLSVDEAVDWSRGKQVVSIGAYAVIFPDCKYINTKTLEWGDINVENVSQEDVRLELCNADGEVYKGISSGETAPEAPAEGALWLDTSVDVLKQYNADVWVTIPQTYVKLYSTGIGAGISQYDGIEVDGVTLADELNGGAVVYACGDDFVVIPGIIDEAVNQAPFDGRITVRRRMPLVDYVTESGNRLWGCRYGVAHNGEFVNEIYCSKLGDFKNWRCYMGISTDSYTASCGTDGPFTGAATHRGYPLFWKENCVHKVYGSVPSNFRIQVTECRGVQKGSWRSLAEVDGVLFYKSTDGIWAYDGSMPDKISEKLGRDNYAFATGCGHCGKYYVSMFGPNGADMFVYDKAKRLWAKDDRIGIVGMASLGTELYGVWCDLESLDNNSKIYFLSGGAITEKDIPWMLETGVIGASLPDSKYLTKVQIRMNAEEGTTFRVFVEYDSSGEWIHLFSGLAEKLRSFTIPVLPKRCDHLRLKIEGVGGADIFSITKTFMMGSDVTW